MDSQNTVIGTFLASMLGIFSISAFKKWLWNSDTTTLPMLQRVLNLTIRISYRVFMDMSAKKLTVQATSLVYTTLLSLVPLLAVSFSTLKAFGVHNKLDPVLADFLTPLGPQGDVIRLRILEFVNNINASVLGSMGLLMLFYTVISLIQKIEESFNDIWYVKNTRRFSQKFSQYLSVIVVGPILIFSAIGLTASFKISSYMQQLATIEPFGLFLAVGAKLLPFILIIIAFTFIYMIVPNTRVNWGCALVGGFVSGIIWETTSWFFTAFIAGSVNYVAVYSVFATLIVFMIWLQLNWLIILIGANITFYCQNNSYLTIDGDSYKISNRVKERLALSILVEVGQKSYLNSPPPSIEDIVRKTNAPTETVTEIVEMLFNNQIIAKIGENGSDITYIPNRPFDVTHVRDVLKDIRKAEDQIYQLDERIHYPPSVKRVAERVEDVIGQSMGKKSLKDLVLEDIKEQKKGGAKKVKPPF
ncbi:MAG: YihY/virulence factor BrkB family protein [Magnetococcales bacterium]|nr:YihY/virulence factor BrkB family protein [Magnetococcales bacterium]